MLLVTGTDHESHVCRTGKITLMCQWDGVDNIMFWDQCGSLGLWLLQYVPRHTALPRTITYQEVVVESYANLRETYRCTSALTSGTVLQRNRFTYNDTQIEGAPKAVQYC